ncbi:hypothetical protein BU24DRAFT_494484 [Aaosphaeria arxii CBS 175.79]|uniref:Uncharacterized protein n=1 Tax=Aaosphaeria arxii CBS 175.79 TaxID=1450172 RepID=A0A6A5XHX4_9PLEO|nr:uncharacterized protein BU24DRAFT_494484 [Aaosphaeria arxii CBS 175.79]KAF2012479.1 hypothetical protein BU24DRAFT_494484 [Aaosphaeria arxii CBS 175.79]
MSGGFNYDEQGLGKTTETLLMIWFNNRVLELDAEIESYRRASNKKDDAFKGLKLCVWQKKLAEEKISVIERFDRLLERWQSVKTKNSVHNDLQSCHIIHAFSPAPSAAIWMQAMGRAVCFEKLFRCLIFEYFVDGTLNVKQLQRSTANALSSIAAMMSMEGV